MAAAAPGRLYKAYAFLPIGRSCRVYAPFCQTRLGCYSTLPDDPDTHEDFKPTNKVGSTPDSLKELVEQDVKENPVMLYMKGVPEFPQCGFSSLAVNVLKHYNVPIRARNILKDADLKSAVKAYSLWPTFPQVFIKGEFIGGSDIVLDMHRSGELKERLKDVSTGSQNSE